MCCSQVFTSSVHWCVMIYWCRACSPLLQPISLWVQLMLAFSAWAALLLVTGSVASGNAVPHRLSNPSHCHSNGEGTWAVGIMEGADWGSMRVPTDNVTLTTADGAQQVMSCPRNPILGCSDVTDINASFIADPFLFFPNGTEGPWYSFFEVKNMNNDNKLRARRGQIGTAVSYDEGRTWTYLQIVLKTTHHLSYPQIIEDKGTIYMLPQGKSMALYKCTSFPTKWRFVKQLITDKRPLNDVTTVFFQDRWWAFGLYERFGKANWMLHIYFAESLEGPWHPTPNNCGANHSSGTFNCVGGASKQPHKRGSVGLRPGGRMFVEDGRLYRMAQDSKVYYGDGMHLYEVTRLKADQQLQEEPVIAFEENFRAKHNVEDWNKNRFHHADLHKIPGRVGEAARWVMLVDGDYNKGNQVFSKKFSQERCADLRNQKQ